MSLGSYDSSPPEGITNSLIPRIGSDSLIENSTIQKQREKLLSRRNCILKELIDTESTYAKSIESGNSLFGGYVNEKKLPSDPLLSLAFSHLQLFRDKALYLHQNLAARKRDSSYFGDIITSTFDAEFVEMFKRYFQNYFQALRMAEGLEQNKAMSSLFNNLRLSQFLGLPLNRLSRYSVLLRDILKCTPPDHQDFTCLENSIPTVSFLQDYQEEIRKDFETKTQIEKLVCMFSEADRPLLELDKEKEIHLFDSLLD
jgi:hypothetical protein